MSQDITVKDYNYLFKEAKELVIAAQQRFLQEANRTNIDLYWKMSKLLAETAKRYQWEKGILARLSIDLRDGLGNAKGYSEQNLRFMRQFYYEYVEHPDLFQIARDVRWCTNILIMSKVKNEFILGFT